MMHGYSGKTGTWDVRAAGPFSGLFSISGVKLVIQFSSVAPGSYAVHSSHTLVNHFSGWAPG